MENNKNGKHSAVPAFFWGFILGAIFATLITTKKGRAILREVINTGTELIEDFLEERRNKAYEHETAKKEKIILEEEEKNVQEAMDDLDTGIGEIETVVADTQVSPPAPIEEEIEIDAVSTESFDEPREVSEEAIKLAKKAEEASKPKKRLFKGLKRNKTAN